MTVVKITVVGIQELNLRFKSLEHRVGYPVVALNRVADDMMRVIGATFTGQGRREGGSWEHLSKRYRQNKINHGMDPRILISSGKLMRSYTQRGDENQLLDVRPSGFTLDSRKRDIGRFHQEGLGNNPKREFIKFYPADRDRWARMLHSDLMNAYRGRRAR